MGLEGFLLFLSGAFGPARGALEGPAFTLNRADLASAFTGRPSALILQESRPIEPKKSPLQGWIFEWATNAFQIKEGRQALRFRVFSQARLEEGDLEIPVARLLSRLDDYNLNALDRDFAQADVRSDLGTIDAYLCFGGDAGAEWRPGQEPGAGGSILNVNVIYIYQLETLERPIDRLREVAHEFGHASLPALRGYTEPEAYVNGDIGERIYLRWLRSLIEKDPAASADAMGITLAELDRYIASRVAPLEQAVLKEGPDPAALALKGRAAFEQAIAAALIAETISPRLMRRAMEAAASSPDPAAFLRAVADEAGQTASWRLACRPGEPVWAPLGGARLEGGEVLERRLGWARIQPSGSEIRGFGRPSP